MSLYSGKFDFCDMCDIHNVDNILKSKVYIWRNIIPLKFETEKDLIPYYPYLVSHPYLVTTISTTGIGEIRLSTESYVDKQERETLEWYVKDCQKYMNKCKRKKEIINIEHFDNQYHRDVYKEILIRLMDKKKEFTLDGIYLPMAEYYRKELYDEMVKNGWDEFKSRQWCFGCRKEYPI